MFRLCLCILNSGNRPGLYLIFRGVNKKYCFIADDNGTRKQGSDEKYAAVKTDTGYSSNRSRSPHSPRTGSRPDEVKSRSDLTRAAPVGGAASLERPGFKTREEFQRDFERRERELKELLARPRVHEQTEHESLGTTTRSDPGGMLDDGAWEYRVTDHTDDFKRLEPDPAYPHDRLKYSRSKSDTDLVTLTPSDSMRYSSPMQPGKISILQE